MISYGSQVPLRGPRLPRPPKRNLQAMPKDTKLMQGGHGSDGVPSGQPVVYLVNADGAQSGNFNLQQVLAPIWRWRWVVCAVLILTVLAGGWYFTRPADLRYQLVIRAGSYPRSLLLEQLEGVIVPQAIDGLPDGWKPRIKIGALIASANADPDDLNTAQSLISMAYPISSGSPAAHAMLLDRLHTALDAISTKDTVIVSNQYRAQKSLLNRKVSATSAAYERISEEAYIMALRGLINKDIQLTEAALRRQEAIYQFQSKRSATLDEREVRIASRLDELLSTMGETDSAFPGTVQVLVDRITSLRLELEDRIPDERLQIERRLNESLAEQDRLAAILSQQKLEAHNFDADLAVRQSAALDELADAENSLALLQAQEEAELIHQPTAIIEELTTTQIDENRPLKTLAILVFGGLCSILSAYALEALRLARLGTLAAD